MLKKNKKGFTLIEIIVVIVILAVLMAVAVPSVLKYINVAQEAPALTEAHAIVTAAQKRVIEKYMQNRTNEFSLDSDDNKWIEEFIDKGGTIQGDVVLANNEVSSLLYKASNGLYVLFENQKYTIVDEDALGKTSLNQLSKLVVDYTQLTNELFASKKIGLGTGRDYLIRKVAEENGLLKVDDSIIEKAQIDANKNLYWKPYYLNSAADPHTILFANYSQTDHGQWKADLVYVDGKIYKCNDINIAFYSGADYNSIEKLTNYIESNPTLYKKVELN